MPTPFIASFTVTQSSDGASFTIKDTSNYNDEGKGTFVSRRLFIYYAKGSPLSYPNSPQFQFADYPGDQITISNQTRDFCLRVSLVLTSSNPQTNSVYTSTEVILLTANSYQFLINIAQGVAANPSILDIPDFWTNLAAAYSNLNQAKTAASYSQQVSAQQALDRFNYFVQNQTILFN
jgi:hypothetical protein